MTTKFSLFPAATTPALTDKAVGLQGGVDVSYTLQQFATLFGVQRFFANIGDGVNVAYVVTHNLGTRDVDVNVYRNGTPWDEVIVDIAHTSTNTITVSFSTAPATNQFRVQVRA
jgi:hypothetical protein